MDPSGIDFMMQDGRQHHRRQPSSTSEHPVGSAGAPSTEQAARSPCPALRGMTAEQGQLPGMHLPPRPAYYDPFYGSGNWRSESFHHSPHNFQNPGRLRGWRSPFPAPSLSQPPSVSPYPYPDPFHVPHTNGLHLLDQRPPQGTPQGVPQGVPRQEAPQNPPQGAPHLFPMVNPSENQSMQTPLPPFDYRPAWLRSGPPARDNSQNFNLTQGTGGGGLPSLNPNTNQNLPTTSAQPPPASLFGEAAALSPLPNINMSHQSSPLPTGPFPSQSESSTSNSHHGLVPRARSESTSEDENAPPVPDSSSPPAQLTSPQNRNDRSAGQETSRERRGPSVRTRRATATLPRHASSAPNSDTSSDDDYDPLERTPHGFGFLEVIGPGGMVLPEDRIRAHQIIRGAASTKRVASKTALASLQTVRISDLSPGDATCVICYNDFGVPNPEGINEAPLRLPKCKHIFGDHCIKKWFEENDTCPYCRDKVHSEPPSLRLAHRGSQEMIQFLHQQHAHMAVARRYHRAANFPGPGDHHSRVERSMPLPLELYNGRVPMWSSYSTSERRSPGNDNEPARRRQRTPRHSGSRTSPSTTRSVGGSTATSSSTQNPVRDLRPHFLATSGPSRDGVQPLTYPPQYPMGPGPQLANPGGRQPPILPGPSSGPGYDMHLPSFSYYYTQMAGQNEHLHSLFGSNQATPGDHFRIPTSHSRADQMPPLSPTIGGPEVDMANVDPSTPRRQTSHHSR